MPTITEGTGAFEFMQSESNGTLSREQVTILSGQNLVAGEVIGKVTASGKYVRLAPAASDGSQLAAGILGRATDATGGDARAAICAREAEVKTALIVFPVGITAPQKTLALAQLEALQIKLR